MGSDILVGVAGVCGTEVTLGSCTILLLVVDVGFRDVRQVAESGKSTIDIHSENAPSNCGHDEFGRLFLLFHRCFNQV